MTTRSFTPRRPSRTILGMLAAGGLALALVSCGGDDSSSAETTAAPSTTASGGSGGEEGSGARVAFAYGFSAGGPEAEFIAGLQCYASQHSLPDPIVTYADADASKALSDFDSLIVRSGEIDGIFAIPLDPVAIQPAYDKARAAGIFVIDPMGPDADGNFPTEADSHVAPDDAGVGQLVVDHIVSTLPDAKTVVIVSPPPGTPTASERAAGFTAAAEAAGLEVVDELNLDQITTEEAQLRMEDYFTSHRDVDVVFSQNGAMARGVALAAESQGVDVAILAIDADQATIEAVRSGEIQAAFGADLFAVGVRASEQVEALMNGGGFEHITLPYAVYSGTDAQVVPVNERCGS